MEMLSLEQDLKNNSYPGRGIVIGRSADGRSAVAAYFIMGRSENSRNRVFVEDGDGIRTQAFDPSKMKDPSLIIYAPVRVLGNKTIVTNGDQTDTIYEGMDKQLTFEQCLRTRYLRVRRPQLHPQDLRHYACGRRLLQLRPFHSEEQQRQSRPVQRFTFAYSDCVPGEGHFIHTYMHDGDPLPSFEGEPKLVAIPDDMDAFTDMLWNSLNEDNKVSLFVRYINIEDGTFKTRIVNKNK